MVSAVEDFLKKHFPYWLLPHLHWCLIPYPVLYTLDHFLSLVYFLEPLHEVLFEDRVASASVHREAALREATEVPRSDHRHQWKLLRGQLLREVCIVFDLGRCSAGLRH